MRFFRNTHIDGKYRTELNDLIRSNQGWMFHLIPPDGLTLEGLVEEYRAYLRDHPSREEVAGSDVQVVLDDLVRCLKETTIRVEENLRPLIWTSEQVENLNNYQRYGRVHPFTCRNRDRSTHPEQPEFGDFGVLRATTQGWVCDSCQYTQNWAHDWMMKPLPTRQSFAESFPNATTLDRVTFWMGFCHEEGQTEYRKAFQEWSKEKLLTSEENLTK